MRIRISRRRRAKLDGSMTCTLAHLDSRDGFEIWAVVDGNLYRSGTQLTSRAGHPASGGMAVWLAHSVSHAILVHRRGKDYFTTAGVRMRLSERDVMFQVLAVADPK